MKRVQYLTLVLGTLISAACLASPPKASIGSASEGSSSTSIDASDTSRIVATIRGSSGIADVQGDKVELRNGIVYVNARSYGAVPAICEIKYIITKSQRQLFVNDKPRTAPPASK